MDGCDLLKQTARTVIHIAGTRTELTDTLIFSMIFVEAYSGGLIFTGEVLVGVITGSAASGAGSGSGSSTTVGTS